MRLTPDAIACPSYALLTYHSRRIRIRLRCRHLLLPTLLRLLRRSLPHSLFHTISIRLSITIANWELLWTWHGKRMRSISGRSLEMLR